LLEIIRLKNYRLDEDITDSNEIKPGDSFSGTVVLMRKKSIQMGRAMTAGETWDKENAWGDPFCVHNEKLGDHFLLWKLDNEDEWFINDKKNFDMNYELVEHLKNGRFTCRKSAVVKGFVIDRNLVVYGKEQNRDPAPGRRGDVLALDADNDPYRIPYSFILEHYDVIEGPDGFGAPDAF